jgi:hypothetical protein
MISNEETNKKQDDFCPDNPYVRMIKRQFIPIPNRYHQDAYKYERNP